MELRHLRYFIAVADELSFTRAALRLHTAQPSLSQQIRNLEDEVGTPLLERTRRKVELTEAGTVFLAEARLVVAQADRAVARARQVAQQGRATVTIGFVPAAEIRVFPAILPRLRLRFPDVNVELRSLPTADQEEALQRGEIDVAFMRYPVRSADLTSEVVLVEPLVVLLPSSHPLAKLERIPPEKLDGEPFISTHPHFSGQVYSVVEAYFDAHKLHRNVAQVATNILLNLNLVGMGLGYALLPAYAASLTSSAICARPLEGEPPRVELLMVSRAPPHPAELAGLFELVREHVAPE
ncbi:DNA-binding transcriptional regulator HcaR [Paraburkholderia caballeronis]|uniref:LysR family transcriptional regulator, hca operon transcriptional activator n=1 Tax=Paraburkholderia caballeronis TaxID=416943 RepID=A0A1H7V6S9_9BURK|nr:DNA-binding transcriptional regulator HcaR [Paraburkholderia caballeronis]PXW16435.1 LysR family hca operon transcriptional activator [Paraburkholderia caballeronis]PXW94288.1 LysR family hca operon transcriptional activator [Paraburkholderia caballeronis]RAJ89685.1 LysR family hca operon transcriptional activator [Paraburkholderia caballeronis]SED91690.1 LysR family transcriptional regulator, hca operon transcriptional activator [Paraburkholderia caballeronis]SEM04824.1 LysR family transcr